MARVHERHPANAPGDWYVDTRCIDCDVSRQLAPALLGRAGGQAVVVRQPASDDEERALWRAAVACPTRSVGTVSHRPQPAGVFPERITGAVWYCGTTSPRSFGAHPYLVQRPDGNLLVDAPRWSGRLAAALADLGGVAHVLLTHRDDVADADRYAERFAARVWISTHDAAAAVCATDLLRGTDAVEVAAGTVAIPLPGHTRGSVAFLVDDRYLFSGDSLAWDRRRGDLCAFRQQCWYSWPAQADSLERLAAGWSFEWVLPGHGDRHGPLPAHDMRRRLQALVARMRAG